MAASLAELLHLSNLCIISLLYFCEHFYLDLKSVNELAVVSF